MTSTVSAPSATPTSPARGLVCRACGAEYPLVAQHACYECFGPLEVAYDQAALARVTRADIESGPDNIWRYAALLPTGARPLLTFRVGHPVRDGRPPPRRSLAMVTR